MKRTVPFEIFGPNQYLQFDILRLAVLEDAIGRPIVDVVKRQDIGISFAIKALPIAMSQHYHNATPVDFAKKIEEYLEGDGRNFETDIGVPLVKAILASGFLGKAVADRAIGLKVSKEPKNEPKAAETPSEPSENG